MRIIASDYDGTLNFGGIDDKKREAIARWQRAGNLFGIVSGRSVFSIRQRMAADGINPDFLVASSGGTVVVGDKVISRTALDGEIALKLARLMISQGAKRVNIHAEKFCFLKPDGELLGADDYYFDTLPEIKETPQVAAECEDIESAVRLVEKINEEFPDAFNALHNNRSVDVAPKGVNKAQGIYVLIKYLGIPKENAIVVGDNNNDIDMLSEFNSYAMANGTEGAKTAAKSITTGICELIEKEL